MKKMGNGEKTADQTELFELIELKEKILKSEKKIKDKERKLNGKIKK